MLDACNVAGASLARVPVPVTATEDSPTLLSPSRPKYVCKHWSKKLRPWKHSPWVRVGEAGGFSGFHQGPVVARKG